VQLAMRDGDAVDLGFQQGPEHDTSTQRGKARVSPVPLWF
jgi:hypothetical protein